MTFNRKVNNKPQAIKLYYINEELHFIFTSHIIYERKTKYQNVTNQTANNSILNLRFQTYARNIIHVLLSWNVQFDEGYGNNFLLRWRGTTSDRYIASTLGFQQNIANTEWGHAEWQLLNEYA